MELKSIAIYISGADAGQQGAATEDRILRDATGKENALPIEAGLKVAGEVYLRRAFTVVHQIGVIATRLTGIAAVYQLAIDKFAKKEC